MASDTKPLDNFGLTTGISALLQFMASDSNPNFSNLYVFKMRDFLGKITKRDFSEKRDDISQDDHTTFSTNQKVDDAKSTIHCFVFIDDGKKPF